MCLSDRSGARERRNRMGSDSLRRGTIRVLATHLLSAIVVLLGWSTPLLAAAANHFAVAAPATVAAGAPFSITVTALDASDMVDTAYGGTVHFTKSDSGAGSFVPGDYTFAPGDNGVHTFMNSTGLVTLGIQTVTATDTTSAITGTSNDINVIAPANHFLVTAPATVTAGKAFSVTVSALNPMNAIDTTYRGTIHFTKSDSGAGSFLPADYTFTAADNGVHTFINGAGLVTLGIQTVTATDTASSITGTSNDINVIAPANHLLVTAPATVTAGAPFSVTVTALNPMNAIDTTYRGTIHFTKSDSGAGSFLPADYTFTAADNGVHT